MTLDEAVQYMEAIRAQGETVQNGDTVGTADVLTEIIVLILDELKALKAV